MLTVLLQRAPALKILLNGLQSQTTQPIARIIQSIALPAAVLSTPHALSGATTSEYSVQPENPATGSVGVELAIGFSINIASESWTIESELPPGLRATDLRKRVNATDGVLPTDFGLITGTPTQAGTWSITLRPWGNDDGTGDTAPEPLVLSITIEGGEAPQPVAPEITFERNEQTLTLRWQVDPSHNFQAEVSNDFQNWAPLTNATILSNSQARIVIPITDAHTTFYRLALQEAN